MRWGSTVWGLPVITILAAGAGSLLLVVLAALARGRRAEAGDGRALPTLGLLLGAAGLLSFMGAASAGLAPLTAPPEVASDGNAGNVTDADVQSLSLDPDAAIPPGEYAGLPEGLVPTDLLVVPSRFASDPWTPAGGPGPAFSARTPRHWLEVRVGPEAAALAAGPLESLGFADATLLESGLPESGLGDTIVTEVIRFEGAATAGGQAAALLCDLLGRLGVEVDRTAPREPPLDGLPLACTYRHRYDSGGMAVTRVGAWLPHGRYLNHVQGVHLEPEQAEHMMAILAVAAHERYADLGDARAVAGPMPGPEAVLLDGPEQWVGPLHNPAAEGVSAAGQPYTVERLDRVEIVDPSGWAAHNLEDPSLMDEATAALRELGFRYELTDVWQARPTAGGAPVHLRLVRVAAFDDPASGDARRAARGICDMYRDRLASHRDVRFAPDFTGAPTEASLAALDPLPVVCFAFERTADGTLVGADTVLSFGPYVIRALAVAPSHREALELAGETATGAFQAVVQATRP